MPRNHNWRIKREYFDLMDRGIKTLEVRVGYADIKQVEKGDTITFHEYSRSKFEVMRVAHYVDFPEMLDNENSKLAIPGVSKYKALEIYQGIYPEEKEALGVYVFELKKQVNEIKIYHLSDYISDKHSFFNKLAIAAYNVTDHICEDYPKHFQWYWTKQIPRVFDGSGEVIVCTVHGKVAGVAFLKKDAMEKKICTIFVQEEYRGNKIANKLLKYAYRYLGTNKPLVTIADYKLPMFETIIQRDGWEQTQIMERGYYNGRSCEYVFNGTLPNDSKA